jgi:hypothetical protein
VPINFNFTYFYQSFTQLTISTNGYVSFGTSSSTSGNWISALNYDLDTRTSGGIYYQNLNSQSGDFNSIKSVINRVNPAFVPTNLFRITYDNVPAWGQRSDIASFQIILANDATISYVLLKYTSCLSSSYLSRIQAIYYLSANEQSVSNQMSLNPCTRTNVNQVGTWVFDASSFNSKFFIIFREKFFHLIFDLITVEC